MIKGFSFVPDLVAVGDDPAGNSVAVTLIFGVTPVAPVAPVAPVEPVEPVAPVEQLPRTASPAVPTEPMTRKEVLDDDKLNEVLGEIPGATITAIHETRRRS